MNRNTLLPNASWNAFFTLLLATSTAFAADAGDCPRRMLSISAAVSTRKVDPAVEINVTRQHERCRITIVRSSPNQDVSRLLIQVFPATMLSTRLANDIGRILAAHFATQLEDQGLFRRAVTQPLWRLDYHQRLDLLKLHVHNAYSSEVIVYRSVAPFVRSQLSVVADASKRMVDFLLRARVFKHDTSAYAVLNRIYQRFLNSMSPLEIHFFTYALFDGVLSYEADAQMTAIAARLRSAGVSDAELDYNRTHQKLRDRFLEQAKEVARAARAERLPRMQEIRQKLAQARARAAELLTDPDHAPAVRASLTDVQRKLQAVEEALRDDADFHELRLAEAVAKEAYTQALAAVGERPKDDPNVRLLGESKAYKDWLNRVYLANGMNNLKSALSELTTYHEVVASNTSHLDAGESIQSRPLHVSVTTITPGNGGTQSGAAFDDLSLGFASSFTNQPRRLNSGPGNRTERFDYTERERD